MAKKPTYADYGYVKAFLDAHKDVKAKVDKAIKEGWTSARLEGEIKTTKWWKDRNDSQRKWDLLSAEQPGEKNRLLNAKKQEIANLASRMGISLSDADVRDFALGALRDGKSDAETQLAMAGKFVLAEDNPDTPQNEADTYQGQAAVAIDNLRKTAAAYGVTVKNTDMLKWTQDIIGGKRTPEELEDTFRESAKALYPPLAPVLDKGQTVQGFVSPYLDIAARQLGITTDMMDLTDSKWTGMIQGGAVLSADEWTQKIRTDARYGWNQSEGAKREAIAFASNLGAIFGGA